MYLVLVYGGDRVVRIVCDTYLEALEERNLRQGMGLVISIEIARLAV